MVIVYGSTSDTCTHTNTHTRAHTKRTKTMWRRTKPNLYASILTLTDKLGIIPMLFSYILSKCRFSYSTDYIDVCLNYLDDGAFCRFELSKQKKTIHMHITTTSIWKSIFVLTPVKISWNDKLSCYSFFLPFSLCINHYLLFINYYIFFLFTKLFTLNLFSTTLSLFS